MAAGKTSLWTPAVVKRFRELCAIPTLYYGDVADQLSREFSLVISKSACVGKANRLGLAANHHGSPKAGSPRYRAPPPQQHRAMAKRRHVSPASGPTPATPAKNVLLEQLSGHECHWPSGDRAPYLFCGATATAGAPYCEHHARLAYHYERGARRLRWTQKFFN